MTRSFLAASFVTEEEKKCLMLIITCLLSCPEVSNDKDGGEKKGGIPPGVLFIFFCFI